MARRIVMKLSKRMMREINIASVADDVLRERFESFVNGKSECFTDNAPDTWNEEQRRAFDMVHEAEYKMKAKIIKVLRGEQT
jgi:hypothetical protein